MLNALKMLGARVLAVAASRRLDRDLDRELDAHLAMLTEENRRRGMSPAEARRMASIRMGNRSSLKAQHREVRGLPALDSMLQDLLFACRLLAKNPGFSAAAILTLALGIGVNAMGFTIVNAAFLRGLPFADGKALHMVSWASKSNRRTNASWPEFDLWRERTRTFSGLAAFDTASMSLSDDHAPPQEVEGAWVTANTFDVLQQPPLFGRGFSIEDGRPGANTVVLIGASVWRNRYGSDPAVIGKPVRINGRPATIVGVTPDGMRFPLTADLWTPFVRTGEPELRTRRTLSVFGRLDYGADRRISETELGGLAQGLPPDPDATTDLIGVKVDTFNEFFIGGRARPMFMVVMGAVCFVLLIACVNVANLLLSRAVTRGREMAVRVSMGATRPRLVRQLLIESALFSVFGGGLGLWLASMALRRFDAALVETGRPYWLTFTIDPIVVGYVTAICLLTALVFGLAPALHVSKTNASEVLKEGGRGAVGSHRTGWTTATLVVAELALTVVLLVGAGLMVRSFLNTYSIDVGIPTDRLMSMRVNLADEKYATPDARRAFFRRAEQQLAAIAGLEVVTVSTGVPPFDGGERLIEVEGQSPDLAPRWISTVAISPSFFDAVDVRVLNGRGFEAADRVPGATNIIVNQQLADRILDGEDAIGRRIRLQPRGGMAGPWQTIVGVSPSIRHGSFQDFGLNPVVYSMADQDPPQSAAFLIRTTLPPSAVMKVVRAEVQAIDPDQPVLATQTVDEAIVQATWPLRVFGGLFALFGVVALTLSAVGLYGVMAHAVSQRTSEIGVRMALGASWRQVASQVLLRGLRHLAAGLAIGVGGALALSRVLQRVLVQTEPADPLTFGAITLLLAVVAMLACILPARRAARIDPMVALRAE